MFNKKNFNFSFIEIFLILSFLICWLSISTSFNDIQNFIKKENNNLNDLINLLRQSFNLSIFPILLVIFLKNLKEIKFKNELLFIFALSYFLLQLPGLFLSDNSHSEDIGPSCGEHLVSETFLQDFGDVSAFAFALDFVFV